MNLRQANLILILLLFFSCTREEVSMIAPQTEEINTQSIKNDLLVEFSDETISRIQNGDASLFPEGIISAERLFPDAGEWEPRHRAAGLHRWYRVGYDSSILPATKAVSEVLEIPGALKAEKERRIKTDSYFNDPKADNQWAFFNDGSRGNNYVAGAEINVEAVWKNYTAGNSDVIVAVLDTGIDMDHEDLGPACIPAGPNGSKCFLDGRTGYHIYSDDHGTHVAGTIAAINNNGIGVSSIAGGNNGNGGVRILACQFLHTDESDPTKTLQGNAANAMVWAADHGAIISQNSWGDDFKSQSEAAQGSISSSMADAIDYFVENAGCDVNGRQRPDSPMKGGIVFFAAGNDGWAYGWPAMYENVIAVGAMDSGMKRCSFSNYGPWVDIAAPGSNILSTTDGNKYDSYQGTSMACPHVSGVAALIASYFGGPGFTNEMLKKRLLQGANTALPSGYQIGPLVDALGAFTYGGTSAPGVPGAFSVSAQSNTASFEWTVPADEDDGKAYAFLLMLAKNAADLSDIKNLPEDVIYCTALTGNASVGEKLTEAVPRLEFSTKYFASIAAYDIAGNFSSLTDIKTIDIPANNPPIVTTDYTGDYIIHTYETRNISYTITDPDNHKFSIDIVTGSDAITYALSGSTCTLRFIGKNAAAGNYEAVITATDEYGAKSELKIPYTILENSAPEIVKHPEDMVINELGKRLTLDMTEYIKDDDGETLKFTITTSESGIIHLNPDKNTLVLTTLGYGMTSVTIKAEDSMGENCSLSFRILVQDGSILVSAAPNPVKDKLGIKVRDDSVVSIRISNKAGAVVFSVDKVEIGPFNPYYISMKDLPGGIYNVKIEGSGLNKNFNIAKI